MKPITLFIATCLAQLPQYALALEQIPEVIVTAQFRETRLMQEANSTSVLSSEAIRARSAQHLEEILGMAPNVNFAGGSSRARFFQIRGIGDRSQFQEPLNPSVGMLIDDIDFSGIGTVGTLFDVEQVEVLRGPQGTLHGANALAGLINIRSFEPTEDFHNRVEATAGDYDTWSLGLVSSGPLQDSLLYRVALQQYNSDGYIENDFLDTDDSNDRDELTARGKLRWLASEDHTVDLNLNWIDVDNGYDTFSLDNNRTTLSDEPGKDKQQTLAAGLQLSSTFDAFTLRGLLSYADTDTDYGYDEDWSYVGFHPDGYSSTDLYQRDRDSYSAELRFMSNRSSRLFKDSTDWAFGLYYLGNDEDLKRVYTYNDGDFLSSYDTDTYAVFAQLDTTLSDRLTLTSGLRWEDRQTRYSDNNAVDFAPDKSLWGGKLALEYAVADDAMLYGSISRGYRGNGVNAEILASRNATDDPDIKDQLGTVTDYDEETLLNYEIGIKGSAMGNTLQARLALFYMNREDQQVNGSFLIAQQSGATTFIDYTTNAADGNNYGAELEVSWLASDKLMLWAHLGLLKTEYEDYINAAGEDLSGRDQAQAPNYQYNLGGRFNLTQQIYLQLEVEGKDDYYFSDSSSVQADDYNLLHGRLGFDAGDWSVALWGRNLTDEDYYVKGYFFENDPRKGYPAEPWYQFGEPRMVGVTGSYTF